MNKIDVVGRINTDLKFGQLRPGDKLDPCGSSPGGGMISTATWLQALGNQANLFGRYTGDDEQTRDWLVSQGMNSYMLKVGGPGAANAVVDVPGWPECVILRLRKPKTWVPTREEGEALTQSGACATLLTGSMDPEYEEFIISTSAALGRPVFYNAGRKANLGLASVGLVHLQVSLAEWGDHKQGEPVGQAKYLATKLMDLSGAASVCVTAGAAGSYSLARNEEARYTPALRLPGHLVRRTVGPGDAHWAAYVSTYIQGQEKDRRTAALRFARVVAGYHVTGASPTSSYLELGLFERQNCDPRSLAA
jgi:sugar/nucleoside kinase (ribokinase family)